MGSKVFLALLLLFLSPAPAHAQGGGVGNGGLAVECADGKVLLPEQLRKQKWIWEDKDFQRADGTPDLKKIRDEVGTRLYRAAPEAYPLWVQLLQPARLDPARWDTIESARTYDINFDVPAGCKLIQVGFNYGGKLYRVLPGADKLDALQGLILGYHESFYSHAVEKIGHTSAVLSRDLNVEMLTRKFSKKRLRQRVLDWKDYNTSANYHFRGYGKMQLTNPRDVYTRYLEGAYALKAGSEAGCSPEFVIIKENRDRAAVYWRETEAGRLVLRESSIDATDKQNRCDNTLTSRGQHCRFSARSRDPSVPGTVTGDGWFDGGGSPVELEVRFAERSCRYQFDIALFNPQPLQDIRGIVNLRKFVDGLYLKSIGREDLL